MIRKVCLDDDRIGPDWAAKGQRMVDSLLEWARCHSLFQKRARSATIGPGSKIIWGMSAYCSTKSPNMQLRAS
jgi:hypothetical protein